MLCVPVQDTPSVKMTYTAAVTVPAPLRALMSSQVIAPDRFPQAFCKHSLTDMSTGTRQFRNLPAFVFAMTLSARSMLWSTREDRFGFAEH